MVGQSQLPARPFLDQLYAEDEDALYLFGEEGNEDYYLSANVTGEVTHNRLKHFEKIFCYITLGLMEKGLDHVLALVPDNEPNKNFARFFGFEDLPKIRAIKGLDGERVYFREMLYVFPELDNEKNA